jgi:protein-(glutamine-N5) methyltransferase, release factor-specific
MVTVRQLIKEAEKKLDEQQKDCNVPKVLFYHLSNKEPHQLYLMMDEEVDEELYQQFQEGMKRYMDGEPIQYIKGKETFFSRDFIVNENVLIPRYETEELVENILYHIDDYFEDKEIIDLCDVGTGSGAIAVTLALEEEKLNVTATDISEEALEVARQNAKELGADVTFYRGDMLEPLIERNIKVDIFVSNPPYIPRQQEIEDVVKDNEPHVALFGGDDGLYFYRKIFERVKLVLKDKALLAFEMGFDQKEIMEEALAFYFPDCPYQILKDMNGKDRMLFIYYHLKEH